MKTHMDSISYAVGMDIAKYYALQKVTLHPQFIFEGFRDMSTGDSTALLFSARQGGELIESFYRMMEAKVAAENEINQKAFLAQNQTQEGVTLLDSGLQYRVIAQGTGASPKPENVVKIRFEGRLLSGTVFVSSDNEPSGTLEADISQVIPGLQLALTRMKPGDRWQVWVPSEMGYGSENRPPITPNSLLIYDIELMEILR